MTPSRNELTPNYTLQQTAGSLMLALRPAEHHVGQTESTTTMTTKGGIGGRCGGLVTWEAWL